MDTRIVRVPRTPAIAQALPLAGRVALVSGGTTGIGLAISNQLTSQGAATMMIGLHPSPEADKLAIFSQHNGTQAAVTTADLRDSAAPTQIVNTTLHNWGHVDILVNCAGSYPRITWDDLNEPHWNEAIDINLNIHYRMAKAVTRHMQHRGWGRIINIGSVNARIGRVGLTAYVTAKAAMEGFTRSLARELGPHGITVNGVSPGAIEVPAERKLPPQHRTSPATQIARQCVPRRGQPDDVAAVVAFLASPATDFITAQTIHVDGGWIPT
ncbi:SDR family NAD(P)-dependent oxidoreductase [Natronoglycomyces albus]|uniref:SDR family oxidoreductase n=1 Tax=Natronoglycomyces albus TaxID=2811108 RepID=A0A895XNT8_9ACTN|nr:SDR family oxidoreductase [Natronoglycomyces albus]QSB03960.1 SDR family oxidoreductase [Natronoglycomyces albus]